MPVDHAEVLLRLKAYVASKPSHGQRDLLAVIGRLEADCAADDGPYHRFLRRFETELEEAFLNNVPRRDTEATDPLTDAAAPATAMAGDAHPSTGPERATEEDEPWKQEPTSGGPPRRPQARRRTLPLAS